MNLNHIAIHSTSRENAIKFYNQLLGFEIAYEFSVAEELAENIFGVKVELNVLMFKKNDISIEVFISEKIENNKHPINHFCLDVKERDGLIKHLRANGIIIKEIDRGDHTTIFVKDFDLNLIEIKE